METVELGIEELLKLNEENLIMMLTPGRMGGDSYIIVYKKENKYIEYYIDYCEEIDAVFPKRRIARKKPDYYEKHYYKDNNYFVIDMGMGCYIFIKKEYSTSFISNVKSLLEQEFKRKYEIEKVLCSEVNICSCWREAAIKTIS